MSAISDTKKAYKDYVKVTVKKESGYASLHMCIAEQYNQDEKKEIAGSFFNYLLQSSASKKLDLKEV